jgi:transcriptional regulator with XRE-family HTH domain
MTSGGECPSLSDMDERAAVLGTGRAAARRPVRGWLRAVREVLGLSQAELGRRLGQKRQSFADMESAEERGAITLASLQRAADAMGCDLIYALLPKNGRAGNFSGLRQQSDPDHRPAAPGEMCLAPSEDPTTDEHTSPVLDSWLK